MKTIRLLPLLMVVLSCSACVPLASFYPLWDNDHVADLPGLEGIWADPEGGILTVAKGTGTSYTATYSNAKERSAYEMHAVQLNGKHYLDFCPDEQALENRLKGEAYLPLVSAHIFAQIVLQGDSLELSLLDDEKTEAKVGVNNPAAPILKGERGMLLTADTKAIQKLMRGLGDDPSVWSEKSTFTRKKH